MITWMRYLLAQFLVSIGESVAQAGVELADSGSIEVELEVHKNTKRDLEFILTAIGMVVAVPLFWVFTVVFFAATGDA